jgi:hypothetical protein
MVHGDGVVVGVKLLDVARKRLDRIGMQGVNEIVLLGYVPLQRQVVPVARNHLPVEELALHSQRAPVELFLVYLLGLAEDKVQEYPLALGVGEGGLPLAQLANVEVLVTVVRVAPPARHADIGRGVPAVPPLCSWAKRRWS